MNIINIQNLKHRFIDKDDEGNILSDKMAIDDVSLSVKQGQFIAILGHNGSGKSTFAKHLNAILMPTSGNVFVNDMNTRDERKIWDIRQSAGMVFQNPDNQIIATVVEEDVGFGPENIGIETEEIWERVNKALSLVEMTEYRKHSPNKLSGGQKQRVAIAGVLAMKPKCIILDEPTAMLDPNGRREVINTVRELNKKEGVTIILVTHNMEEVINADYIFVMDKGRVAVSGTPTEVFSKVEELYEIGLNVPQPTELAYLLEKGGMNIKRGILTNEELIENICKENGAALSGNVVEIEKDNITEIIEDTKKSAEPVPLLEADNITYFYSKDTTYEKKALDGVSFDIYEGEMLGIIGHTGSGKSTLICHLNGLDKAYSGDVRFRGKSIYDKKESLSKLRKHIGIVFQYPEYQLFESSVLEDVCFGAKNIGLDKKEAVEAAKQALSIVGIGEEFYSRSPFELSGGEKRRVAIAGVLVMKPEVLILDEPTAGLDPRGRDEILGMLKRLNKENKLTIIIVSHSMEDMGKYADRLLVMSKGKIIYNDTPDKVFENYKELEKLGLAAPQSVYILEELKKRGFNIKKTALTPERAAELILEYKKD